MARGAFPSMTALLGLLAVAGFQNRDKIGELLGGRSGGGSNDGRFDRTGDGAQQPGGLDRVLAGLGGGAAGGGLGGMIGGGLKELSDRFRQNGQGEAVDSWVGAGPNRSLPETELERAMGSDVIEDLMERTGLSRQELLARLSRDLPDAVDRYTPNGRIDEDDIRRG